MCTHQKQMNSNNFNIFVGDRSYKTNFFLQFKSPRIETKFREETFTRNRYSLKGFAIFTLLLFSIHFMTTDCFAFYHSCGHTNLLVSAMVSTVIVLVALHFRTNRKLIQILMIIFSIYFYIRVLEVFEYHTSLIVITVYTSIASK